MTFSWKILLCLIILIAISNQVIYVNAQTLLGPLKQFKSGTLIQDIKCKDNFVLVIKVANGHPACIMPTSVIRLLAHGWITIEKFEISHQISKQNKTETPTFYDDFHETEYILSDGQISPNGLWTNKWNGHGLSGVKNLPDRYVFFEYPMASVTKDETRSVLVISNSNFTDQKISIDVKTVKQTRLNDNPNTWEVAWVLFRFTDKSHFYWFTVKTNGIELGKLDGEDKQIFLYTANQPKNQIGSWSHWDIQVVHNHIIVFVNGVQVIDYYDDNMSPQLSSGKVGLYSEDSFVNYSNIIIRSLGR